MFLQFTWGVSCVQRRVLLLKKKIHKHIKFYFKLNFLMVSIQLCLCDWWLCQIEI